MIECRGLCKTYRVAKREAGLGNAVKALFSREYELVRALREVSFTVQDGEIVRYIGPNGAGKSTTKKTLRIKYRGQMPELFEGAALLEKQGFASGESGPGEEPGGESAGEMTLSLDPKVRSVSAAIADLAAQTELLDVSVTDITAEEMVVELYKEYQISFP